MTCVRVDDFDYDLPEELIAQTPLEDRSNSRLMIVDPIEQTMVHRHFRDIVSYLQPGDVLILNNSKVLPARLYGIKADTGAKIELLLTRPVKEHEWIAMAKPAKRLKKGTRIQFFAPNHESGQAHVRMGATADSHEPGQRTVIGEAEVTGELEEGLRQLRFYIHSSMEQFLDRAGSMPLPPYIHTPLKNRDRYQTVYAKTVGSVAAPTAGLHFTEALLQDIQDRGVHLDFVTLHVGLGTFRPVQVENVEEHVMHSEVYEVSERTAEVVNRAKAEGRRVIAVGTTALRTLESATVNGRLQSGGGETDIFIYPGYKFRMVDALITNFHLPKSTLLMLVSAFMGTDFTRHVYQEAVREKYRFFSFGDAMFITRRNDA
jgi:S-adenosylmethionine:tRNA ribosyltransferase-isomerase